MEIGTVVVAARVFVYVTQSVDLLAVVRAVAPVAALKLRVREIDVELRKRWYHQGNAIYRFHPAKMRTLCKSRGYQEH